MLNHFFYAFTYWLSLITGFSYFILFLIVKNDENFQQSFAKFQYEKLYCTRFLKRGHPFTKQTLILTDKISLTANPQRILQATVGFFSFL